MKQSDWWRTRDRSGLTVIELVMVCVIIGLVATWALPKFDINRYRADAAGRLVRTLLQTAQRNAITRQSDVLVGFDVANNKMRMVQDYNNNGMIDSTDLVEYRGLEEGAVFSPPAVLGISGVPVTRAVHGLTPKAFTTVQGLTRNVIFGRDGSASGTVEIYVTTRVGVDREYRGILLTQSTGRSDLYKWNGSAWIQMTQ